MSMQRQTAKIGQVVTPTQGGLLQRACACGKHTGGGECAECRQQREGTLQRKAADLIVGPASDQFEQEADRVAAIVIGGASVSGAAGAPSRLQRRTTTDDSLSIAPPIVHDVLQSPGQPLDTATRSFMEPRFGHDFSGVRVHSGAQAAESARAVNALAYTVGRDVVFGAGQHQPQSSAGQRLMAHELTHVVQQSGIPGNRVGQNNGTSEESLSTQPIKQQTSLHRKPLSIQRDIVDSRELPTGKFEIKFKKFEGTADAIDAGVSKAADYAARAGEEGVIKFTPSATAPKSSAIRFLQVARLTRPDTKELADFEGKSKAPLNEIRSRPGEYAEGGFFVDTLPSYLTKRSRKSDLPRDSFYNNPDLPSLPQNHTGSNMGGTLDPAVLEDRPSTSNPRKYEFISTAKASDTGAWYGSVIWSFEVFLDRRRAKVRGESVEFDQWKGRDTSNAAVKAFDEYYRNPGASTEPSIP